MRTIYAMTENIWSLSATSYLIFFFLLDIELNLWYLFVDDTVSQLVYFVFGS